MVNIELTKSDNKIKKIRMHGHANAGKYGEDLVCAALTGIMTGALNAYDIDYHNDVELTANGNDLSISVKNLNSDELQATLRFLVNQIKTITIQYPKNAILKEVN